MNPESIEGTGAGGPLSPHSLAVDDVHAWFSLTYANYLVVERTVLQSMPEEWQQRFVACLRELDKATQDLERAPRFRVSAVDVNGRYVHDPVPHYDRGRARVELLGER